MAEGGQPSERERQLRDVWQRWNEGERGSIVGEITPDCELTSHLIGETFRGRAGIEEWMSELDRSWARWQLWVDEVREDSSDRMLVLGGVELEGKGSGVAFKNEMGWVLEFEGMAMSRMTTYPNRDDAVAEFTS